MESEILKWIPTVVTVIAFVANAAYIKGVFGTKITQNCDDIKELKEQVATKALCETKHHEVNFRLSRIEKGMNGMLKWDGTERRHE